MGDTPLTRTLKDECSGSGSCATGDRVHFILIGLSAGRRYPGLQRHDFCCGGYGSINNRELRNKLGIGPEVYFNSGPACSGPAARYRRGSGYAALGTNDPRADTVQNLYAALVRAFIL
jgi:hypothetical protein